MMAEWQYLYPWFKSLHVIAMVCWFAGLFYLPRLFVYHAMSHDQTSLDRFIIMERKLYRGIMWPSLMATWLFGGFTLALNTTYYMAQPWMHIKLTLVVLLTLYHLYCGVLRTRLMHNAHYKSHIYFRWFNELPVLVLIAVCILVIVKPQF